MRAGELLDSSHRRTDTVARTGGEEFAVVLPETSETEGYLMAEKLRTAIEDAFRDDTVPLTVSFGLASFPAHGTTSESLLAAADRALYAAKELGRNRTVIYSDEIASIGQGSGAGQRRGVARDPSDHDAGAGRGARPARRRHRRPLQVGRPLLRPDREHARFRAGPHAPGGDRRPSARHRQDRHPRLDPGQVRPARRERVGGDAPPSRDRRRHPWQRLLRRRPRLDPRPPRAPGRARATRTASSEARSRSRRASSRSPTPTKR